VTDHMLDREPYPYRVTIGGVFPVLDCLTRGDTWNGFASPLFERAAAETILRATQAQIEDDRAAGIDPSDDFVAWYDAAADVYHFCPLWAYADPKDRAENDDAFGGFDVTVAGATRHVYAIGAWCWTWEHVRVDEA
jgi:hypothetical protein